MEPNRQTGAWLPEVSKCPNRAIPCGNPTDADEAMRAGQIEAAGGGILAGIQVNQAMNHARTIAKHCSVPEGECPLEQFYGVDRVKALDFVKHSVQ